MKEYEVVVIGGGPGGYEAALNLAKAGIKTLLIERAKERIGGVCLNEGCIPAKNYLESAGYVSNAKYFQDSGVKLELKGLNLEQLREKTESLINEIRTGVLWLLEQAGVALLYGNASFVDANTVDVSDQKIGFKKCIVAIGSLPRELPKLPLDGKRILCSSDIFKLTQMPKSIAIIGSGPIGCEFATFFSAFGVEVTIISRSSQLLPSEDEDISKALLRAFKKLNINVITSARLSDSEINERGVKLFVEANMQIQCELVLSAAGRVVQSGRLNLENAGVELDERGYIKVSQSFETTQEHIYATGDCIQTPAFAHTAYAEAKIVAKNIINSQKNCNEHITPSTIFTNPAVASCGLKEKEAAAHGISVEVKKAYFKVNARAKIHGDDSGFAKIVVCAKSGVILGASIIGVGATEIIHELVLAVEKKVTYTELKGMIHAHPTLSEIISYL